VGNFQNAMTRGAAAAAKAEAIASQLPGRIDGPADSYRHFLISAELQRSYSSLGANLLLYGHELDLGFSSNSALDYYTNEIGSIVEKHVQENNGTWNDVKTLAREWVLKSWEGVSGVGIDSWVEKSIGNETYYVRPGGKVTITGLNSQPLQLNALGVGSVASWLDNPKNMDSQGQITEIPDEATNLPTGTLFDWLSRFDNDGANETNTYIGEKPPQQPTLPGEILDRFCPMQI